MLQALSGFRYSAVSQTLWFGPKIGEKSFKTFFSAASGFGTIQLDSDRLTVEMLEGKLPVKQLRLSVDQQERVIAVTGTASATSPLVVRFSKTGGPAA